MHYLIIAVLAFALSMLGCEGKTGPAGPTGAAGAAGPAGPAGPQGSTGPAGPQGPAGADGAQGEKGDPGPPGADGADGAPGPPGPKGDPGEDGADGAPGAGADPVAIGEIIDGVIQGGALADIHHIKLIQDGDADNIAVFNAHENFSMTTPGDDNEWNTTMDFGDETTIVAKAATQTEEAIDGVTFTWASKDTDVATVDDGMIDAVGTGSSEITVTAEGRGIAVKFTVTVLSEVEGILITSPSSPFYLANGESVALEAEAYDKALKDGAEADGSKTVDVDVTFASDNTDVIEIEGSTATAVGVGSAKITAHYADVKSPAITINVTPGGDITHKLTYTRIVASQRTYTRVYNADDVSTAEVDESETLATNGVRGPGYESNSDATMIGTGGEGAALVVTYTIQVREFDSEGNAEIDVDLDGANHGITFRLQGTSVAEGGVAVSDAGAGIVLVTVTAVGDGIVITEEGQTRIILMRDGADDVVLPAIIVVKEQLEAAS